MKKRYISIAAFSFAAACVLSVLVFTLLLQTEAEAKSVSCARSDVMTMLVAGVDESARNTDVLLLISVSKTNGSMKILQIPRDTYLQYGEAQGKINGYFRRYTEKYGEREGAKRFTDVLSDALGIPIDAYAIFSAETLKNIVDTMGGVTFDVPYTMEYTCSTTGETRILKAGVQHLNGEAAAAFVRHRESYMEGDLGRLDAQMRFMAAFIKRLQAVRSFRQYKEIYQKNRANLLTNLTEKDIINFIMVYLKNKGNVQTHIMRLPGEACRGNKGAWFYVLNRAGCAEMLSAQFGVSASDFDSAQRFVRRDREVFTNIYHAPAYRYRIYSLRDAENADVLHK